MTRKRYNKRQRNKSSPQTTQDSKKYRSTLIEDIAEVETESDNSDISDLSSTTQNSGKVSMATSDQRNTTSETNMDTNVQLSPSELGREPPSQAQPLSSQGGELNCPPAQIDTPPPPPPHFLSQPVMGANMATQMSQNMYMPSMSPMNMNTSIPQQMLGFAGQMQHVPQTSVLSDSDILRMALQMKALLKEDIDRLIEVRIALEVEPLKTEIAAANKSIAELQQKVKELAKQNDDLEQYSRKSCLRLTGIKETANENVNQAVLELANRVGADIKETDIVAAHRLGGDGQRDTQESSNTAGAAARNVANRQKCRDIIVKFLNYDARYRLLKGRTKLREEHAKIFINEELTRTRRSLAYESRQLKKNNLIKKTWVYKGNVYIVDKSDQKSCVSCLEDLNPYRS